MASISAERLEQLEAAERRLLQMQEAQSVAWVGQRLGEAWALSQASKPWEQWSTAERMLLHAVCGNASTALYTYKGLLPKA